MAWTDGVDRAVGYIVPAAVWNDMLGITGSLMYLKTRQLVVPITLWYDDTAGNTITLSALGAYPRAVLDTDDYACMYFDCPDQFASIVEAKAVCIGVATDAATNIDIYADFAATGEIYTTHQTSDVASTYAVTINKFFEIDLATILAAMSAGDHVGIKVLNKDANNVIATGMFLRYLIGT